MSSLAWEYEDPKGSGQWRRFDAQTSDQISAAIASGTASVTFTRKDKSYDLDLKTMLQKNSATGYARPIRDCGATNWQWEDGSKGSGKWADYEGEQDTKLKAAVASGQSTLTLTMGGNDYDVDLQAMAQTKRASGYVRNIRGPSLSPATWEWEDGASGSGTWKPCASAALLPPIISDAPCRLPSARTHALLVY